MPVVVQDRRDASLHIVSVNQKYADPIYAISVHIFRCRLRVPQNTWLNAEPVHLNQPVLQDASIVRSLKNRPAHGQNIGRQQAAGDCRGYQFKPAMDAPV